MPADPPCRPRPLVPPMPRPVSRFVLLAACLAAAGPAAGQDDGPPLANFYGFGELELLNVEDRSDNLRAGDVNGDGRGDIYLADDSHSRLDLFLRRAEPETDGDTDSLDVNALPDAAGFEHVKLSVDRPILGLVAADFTGDGRADLAYIGAPDRLVVVIGPEAEGDAAADGAKTDWSRTADLVRRERRLPDLQSGVGILAAGDLTGDGRTDLAVLGQRVTYILAQTAGGEFAPAVEVRNTSEDPALVQIADLDGDGLEDLSYTARAGDDRVFAARLQERADPAADPAADGDDQDGGDVTNTLGPELQFDLVDPRSVTLGDVFADEPGAEVLAVTGNTGRLTVRKVRRPKLSAVAEGGDPGRKLTQYGFGGRGDRDLAVGDVDGDGRADVLVSDPDGARVILFRQTGAGGLDLGTAYPSLAGAGQVRIGDADGDGRGEAFVLSETEGVIGRSTFEDGRLSFPAPVPGVSDPVAFALLPDAAGNAVVFYVSESGRRKYTLGPAGAGEDRTLELDISGDPDRLEIADVDGSGAPDLLLFPGRDKNVLAFGIGADGKPEALANEGLGPGEADPGALFAGSVPTAEGGSAPALLVARGNIARDLTASAYRPAEDGPGTLRWSVRDQFNAGEADAKIAGAVTLDVDGAPGEEVVLIDTGVDKLRVFKRDGAGYEPAGEIETGKFPYRDARVADLNGDGRDDLLLFGEGRFAVLYAGRTDPELAELASYETDLDRTYLADSLVGDLNGDGEADVAVLDVRSHYVEILGTAGGDLTRVMYWKLFEEKNFDGEGGGGLQPREGAIRDVTGDGRADLILLVHDRVLIYPQDNGLGGDDAGGDELGEVETGAVD